MDNSSFQRFFDAPTAEEYEQRRPNFQYELPYSQESQTDNSQPSSDPLAISIPMYSNFNSHSDRLGITKDTPDGYSQPTSDPLAITVPYVCLPSPVPTNVFGSKSADDPLAITQTIDRFNNSKASINVISQTASDSLGFFRPWLSESAIYATRNSQQQGTLAFPNQQTQETSHYSYVDTSQNDDMYMPRYSKISDRMSSARMSIEFHKDSTGQCGFEECLNNTKMSTLSFRNVQTSTPKNMMNASIVNVTQFPSFQSMPTSAPKQMRFEYNNPGFFRPFENEYSSLVHGSKIESSVAVIRPLREIHTLQNSFRNETNDQIRNQKTYPTDTQHSRTTYTKSSAVGSSSDCTHQEGYVVDQPTQLRTQSTSRVALVNKLDDLFNSDNEEEMDHLDESGNEIQTTNEFDLNDFTINEYFERFKNITVFSDYGQNEVEEFENGSVKEGDLGFAELDENSSKPRKINFRAANRLAKMKGESYKRYDGTTVVPARCIKNACSCVRLKCYEKFSDDTRSKMLAGLLQLSFSGQNQVISNNMGLKVTSRPTVLNSRRSFTRTYFLPAINGKVQVCKSMFTATFDIKDKKLRILASKQLSGLGIASDDLRINNRNPRIVSEEHRAYILDHIQSFPAYTSHYTRESTSKKYLSSDLNVVKMYGLYKDRCVKDGLAPVHVTTYRILFRSQNLSFRKPKADTCCTCDKYSTRLKVAKVKTERAALIQERDKHQNYAQEAYENKRIDVQAAKTNKYIRTASFDLQKCLPTPHLQCGTAFYCRQLYTLNFTVFNTNKSGNSASCYMWDESKARRGSQEISSCLLIDLNKMDKAIREVNYYSDRCAGQNLNFVICMMFSFYIYKCNAENRDLIIRHKFMTSGHSHMEVDSVHACIEKAKKRTTMDIETPRDWAVFVSTIERRVPFVVHEMEQKNFLAFKMLKDRFRKPKCNSLGELIRFKDISMFEYRSENPGIIFYKYTLNNTDFMTFDISQNDGEFRSQRDLPPITSDPLPLSNEKLADLRKLMAFVTNKAYYAALLGQLAPKKRGRKSKNDVDDHFEADLDLDTDHFETCGD